MKGATNLFVLLCVFLAAPVQAAKILSIFSFPSPSHYIFASALLKELAGRGHQITSLSTYPQKVPIENFRDIFLHENVDILNEYFEHVKMRKSKGLWEKKSYISDVTGTMCKNIFENLEVKRLMNSTEEQFDLIIVETLWDDSLYGLGQHFKAPMIGVSTFGTIGSIDDTVGNISPVSYVPHLSVALDTRMNFWERFYNFYMHTMDIIHLHLYTLPLQKQLYNKYFPNAELSFEESRKNFSLVLLNQHHSLSYPRPYVPNMIDVGGLHIKGNSKKMPKDLETFLNNATEGVIYFSMGSNLQSKDFTQEKRNIFMNVFRKLKQKIVWKFEDKNFGNDTDNLFLSNWLPQPAVLAHPNVKLFMTHGGLLSITEAIYHAKPILGLPMFADQPKNIAQSVKRGFALSVNFFELTEQQLETTINELLYNNKYTDTVEKISKHFHDQPLTPMDNAVYWVEYVLRHGQCNHLRNGGMELNFWQYHSLDILLSLACLALLLIRLMGFLCKKVSEQFKSKVPMKVETPDKKTNLKLKQG